MLVCVHLVLLLHLHHPHPLQHVHYLAGLASNGMELVSQSVIYLSAIMILIATLLLHIILHHLHQHVHYLAGLASSGMELVSQSVIYLNAIMILIVTPLLHIILPHPLQQLPPHLQLQLHQHVLDPADQASRIMEGVRYNVIFQNVIMILTAWLPLHPPQMNTCLLMKSLFLLTKETVVVAREEALLHQEEAQDSLSPTLILAEWQQGSLNPHPPWLEEQGQKLAQNSTTGISF